MDSDKNEKEAMTGTDAVETPPRYRKRGRPQKDDKLNVIDGGFAGAAKRPDPPEYLPATHKKIWRQIVASEPVDFFQSQATQEMLLDLVGHRAEIDRLNAVLYSFKNEWVKNGEGFKRYNALIKARGNETSNYSKLATRLRLTNQSRYTPAAAATASRNTAKVRPWEED